MMLSDAAAVCAEKARRRKRYFHRPEHSAEDEANDIVGFFQSKLELRKPVEVEFLMKDKLTPGMNKAEREALELRNTVLQACWRLNWKGCALPGRRLPQSGPECQYRADPCTGEAAL